MNRAYIKLVLVLVATAILVIPSMKTVAATSQFDKTQNITCDLACQEAIINEADSDDIVDRMMEECGLLQPNMNADNVECTDRILEENITGNE